MMMLSSQTLAFAPTTMFANSRMNVRMDATPEAAPELMGADFAKTLPGITGPMGYFVRRACQPLPPQHARAPLHCLCASIARLCAPP